MKDRSIKKRRFEVLICLSLAAAILLVYLQVANYNFTNYDDELYVTENPNVKAGFTIDGIFWAFTTGHAANWHPVTWLSHMLDSEIYGLNPMGHHWSNLQIHIANTILLFLFFNSVTGALWRSFLVAALFAIHPLHVESVTWVSERKDVLCAFFWILSMWAYVGYVRNALKVRYVLLIILFVLGLMSKPMIVTLPFVLLLFDFWPLLRIQSMLDKKEISASKIFAYLIREKIPLFVLAAISCLITFFVQQQGGAIASVKSIPLNPRIANAFVSYIRYIVKMVWPSKLAIFYPQQEWLLGQVVFSVVFIIGISTLVIRVSHKFPYLFTGWFWYLGTLVPVIGLVQAGSQSMADRYTYIPLVGLFIIIAWGMTDISLKCRARRIILIIFSSALVILFMICSWFQVRYWKNGITLFKHAVNVTRDNSIAHYELAHALDRHGRFDEAIIHFTKSIQLNPKFGAAHNKLGVTLMQKGDLEGAVHHHFEALRIDPKNTKAHNNLGNVLAQQGDFKNAIDHYKSALQINPNYAGAYYNLGKIFANQDKIEDAIFNYRRAILFNPNMTQAIYNLSWILATNKDKRYRNGEEAVKLAEKLCKITRNTQPIALDALAAAYAEIKKFDDAILTAQKALKLALLYGPKELVLNLKKRLQLYKARRPFRQPFPGKNET